MHIDELRTAVNGLMPRLRADLDRLVRLPSVAFPGFPEGPLLQTADAVADLFREAGMPEVRLLDIGGAPPAVFAARPAAPGAPTALLYAHYDIQPAGPEQAWTSPPFEPTERGDRLYGRGAADNKSGIVMHTGALTLLGPGSPVGVKVLIEGHEEVGGSGIEDFVATNVDLLSADVIVIADTGNYALGVPTLTTSLRGMAALDVTVETLEGALHSGLFGGPAPDALIALSRMIATLHTAAGDVAVEGLETVAYDGADYDEEAYRADAAMLPGVHLIGGGTVAERLFVRPSINVIGLDAPVVDGAANALVPRARARVSVRVAPGCDPIKAQDTVARHLMKVAPWGVKITITPGTIGEGFLAGTGGPAYAAASDALAAAFGREVVHFGGGGSIPLVAAFLKAQPHAEMVLWGAEDPQARIHAPNESVDLGELKRCVLAEALFLDGMCAAR